MEKAKVSNNLPLHVASAVYQLAKLKMLEFYYDFLDKYHDRAKFQMIEMDTDSIGSALLL